VKISETPFLRGSAGALRSERPRIPVGNWRPRDCLGPKIESSGVELWFAAADFPKGAGGPDVVTKAALLTLLLDLLLRHVIG